VKTAHPRQNLRRRNGVTRTDLERALCPLPGRRHKNAFKRRDFGLIHKWLRHAQDIYRFHSRKLEAVDNSKARLDRMVEINVMEQVDNLAETSMVQRKWEEFGRPVLHGWIYGLRTGSLKGHACPRPGPRLDPIYMFDFWDKPPQSRQP
jgi:carbonic anhydrase